MQEQKRENAKQRKVIEDLAIRTKQKEKDAAMALHKETLKTGGSTRTKKKKKGSKKKDLEETSEDEVDDLETLKTGGSTKPKKKKASKKKELEPTSEDEVEVDDLESCNLKTGGSTKTKKKKASKKKELEPTSDDEVEVDDLESCKIIKHKTDKRQGEIKVEVKWDDSGKTNWQYLYDMWADYPGEVKDYKKKNQTKCKGKLCKVPNMGDVEYFVRILGMLGGSENVKKAEFIVLANNGYKFDGEDCVKYDELQADDPELLQAFLDSVEDSPEADDASIA